MMVEQTLKDGAGDESALDLKKLLWSLERIEPAIPAADIKTRARARKVRGQCLEAEVYLSDALQCYQEALELDPKAGVKRRVDQITKRLSNR